MKVAFVGAGRMAREHLSAFSSIEEVTLAGIYSRTRAGAVKLADEFGVETVCDDIEALHRQTDADIVVVAVSISASRTVAETCFHYPWTALLEKPPGLNLLEARKLAAAAANAGVMPFIGLNRRFFGSTAAVLDALTSQPGERFVSVVDQEDRREAIAVGHPEEVVHYWMYANAIHVVDYLNVFCRGTVTGVDPILDWNLELDSQQVIAVRVSYDSGDRGLYQAVWNGPGPWAVSVHGGDSRWELRPLESAAVQARGERRLTPLDLPEPHPGVRPGLREQALAVIDAASGQPSNAVTLSESLQTMELIGAIYGM